MYFSKKSLKGLFTFLLITLFSLGSFAQVPMQAPAAVPADYSDAELRQFAGAVQKVLNIQEASQGKMMASIEESDLTVDRFNEMLMQGQQQGLDAIEATEEEMTAFNNALNDVQQLQQQMQMDMMDAITEEGLDVQKYQGIMQAYEQNPEIQAKIDALFEELENRR
jgi:hypothetical protein